MTRREEEDAGETSTRVEVDPSRSGISPGDDGHEIPFRRELQRKALHVLALTVPISMLYLGRSLSIALLIPLTLAAIGADVLRTRSVGFSRWLHATFGFMMRPDERPGLGAKPRLNGATWVLVGASLLVLLFPIEAAVPAFASFIIGDAAAAIVGRRFGRRRWSGSTRTLEGSAAFVVVGVPAMLPFTDISVAMAAASVVVGAALEIPRGPLNDNVRVPLAMALVLLLLGG